MRSTVFERYSGRVKRFLTVLSSLKTFVPIIEHLRQEFVLCFCSFGFEGLHEDLLHLQKMYLKNFASIERSRPRKRLPKKPIPISQKLNVQLIQPSKCTRQPERTRLQK